VPRALACSISASHRSASALRLKLFDRSRQGSQHQQRLDHAVGGLVIIALGSSQIRPSSNGLTVRCFRNDRSEDGGVRHTWPGWCRWPGRCPWRADARTGVRLPTAWGHQHGHRWPCGGYRGHGIHGPRNRLRCLGPLLPQATAASSKRHGRFPAAMATVAARSGTGAVLPDTAGHSCCGRPPCRPGSGHRGRTAASGVRPADAGGYRNRSPGRRPLVGCSQRRWTRATRAVRRPRSWPRA
jgi:hypothetical protein